jgi:hypothetical protein
MAAAGGAGWPLRGLADDGVIQLGRLVRDAGD